MWNGIHNAKRINHQFCFDTPPPSSQTTSISISTQPGIGIDRPWSLSAHNRITLKTINPPSSVKYVHHDLTRIRPTDLMPNLRKRFNAKKYWFEPINPSSSDDLSRKRSMLTTIYKILKYVWTTLLSAAGRSFYQLKFNQKNQMRFNSGNTWLAPKYLQRAKKLL